MLFGVFLGYAYLIWLAFCRMCCIQTMESIVWMQRMGQTTMPPEGHDDEASKMHQLQHQQSIKKEHTLT